MTDNVPVNQALYEGIDLSDFVDEHGPLHTSRVENGIAKFKFADDHVHSVDVTDYSAMDESPVENMANPYSGPEPVGQLTEQDALQARQMALATVVEVTQLSDPVELVKAADVIANWLIAGSWADPAAAQGQEGSQEARGATRSDLWDAVGLGDQGEGPGRETGVQTPS